jgi:hypothetical protein
LLRESLVRALDILENGVLPDSPEGRESRPGRDREMVCEDFFLEIE